MLRLIDADAMEKDLREQYEKVFVEAGRKVKQEDYFIERSAAYEADRIKAELDSFFKYLASRPTIDPVKHGKWGASDIPDSILSKCSVCGFSCGAYTFNYCPDCGSRMDGDQE